MVGLYFALTQLTHRNISQNHKFQAIGLESKEIWKAQSREIYHYKKIKMGSQSVIAKVTEQRNDLHSWQYPAHARKKKTKVEF